MRGGAAGVRKSCTRDAEHTVSRAVGRSSILRRLMRPSAHGIEEADMQSYLQVMVTYDGHSVHGHFAELPRRCPVCNHHTDPWRLAARSTVSDDSSIDFAFQCARPDCRRVFVAGYHLGDDGEYDLDPATLEPWARQLVLA
jgi:hypothetical protein